MVDGDPELGSVVGVYMFKVHLGVGPKLSKTMPRPPAIRLGLVVYVVSRFATQLSPLCRARALYLPLATTHQGCLGFTLP